MALLTTQRITAEREGLQNKFTYCTSQRKSECWTEQVSDFYSHVVLAWLECDVCVCNKNSRESSIYLGLRVESGVGPDKKALGMFCWVGMLWFGLVHLTWDVSC